MTAQHPAVPESEPDARGWREAVEALADEWSRITGDNVDAVRTWNDAGLVLRALLAERTLEATEGEREDVCDHPSTMFVSDAIGWKCYDCSAVIGHPAEPDAGLTCKATSFGVPTDDHVTTCRASATEEGLDLTGQWVPICDAHGRGRGVPEDRLRPLSAEVDAGDVEALAGVLFASWTAQGTLYSPFVATRDDARTDAVAVLSSDWLAARDAATADRARRESAVEALREAADEMWRIFLRLPHAPSPLGDYIQRRVIELRDRAARIARSTP